MPSVFPGAIDTFPTLVDNVDTIRAEEWNNIADAIVAIENALGANLSILVNAGEIRMWSGTIDTIPNGWLHCDGSAKSRNVFASLFAAIGTAYGVGDGSTTFNLPNTLDTFLVAAKQDSGGIAKSNLEGSLNKTGGSLFQPPITSSQGLNGSVTGGPNQNLDGGHTHTFTPPFIAMVYMIKT